MGGSEVRVVSSVVAFSSYHFPNLYPIFVLIVVVVVSLSPPSNLDMTRLDSWEPELLPLSDTPRNRAYLREDRSTAPTFVNTTAIAHVVCGVPSSSPSPVAVPLLDMVAVSSNPQKSRKANYGDRNGDGKHDEDITRVVLKEVLTSVFFNGLLRIGGVIVEGAVAFKMFPAVASTLGLREYPVTDETLHLFGMKRASVSLGGRSGGVSIVTDGLVVLLVYFTPSSNLLSAGPNANPAGTKVVVENIGKISAVLRQESATSLSGVTGLGNYDNEAQQEIFQRAGGKGPFETPNQRGGENCEPPPRSTPFPNPRPSRSPTLTLLRSSFAGTASGELATIAAEKKLLGLAMTEKEERIIDSKARGGENCEKPNSSPPPPLPSPPLP